MWDFSGQLVDSAMILISTHALHDGSLLLLSFFFLTLFYFDFIFLFSLTQRSSSHRRRRLRCRANVVKVGCILFRFPRGGRDVLYRSVVS